IPDQTGPNRGGRSNLNGPEVRQSPLPDDSGMIPEGLTGIIVGQTKTRQPDGLAGLFWLRERALDFVENDAVHSGCAMNLGADREGAERLPSRGR
ncbi:hypothetical protein, partial [Palleronia pontilimi]|uniref:hypothetical protein n=1 Tax=Palleronia pontilimi TaxID=1964209 RepID=UPI001BE4B19F